MPVCYCKCATDKIRNTPYAPCDSEITRVGMVLDTYEQNGYDDSDFHAVVWDGAKVTSVCYASTRSWTYHNGATVDATEDTKASALVWYRAAWLQAMIERAHAEAVAPAKGKIVRSLTTRGKNVGIVGIVKWIGEDGFQPRYGGQTVIPMRVGIKVDGEQKLRYLALERCEVIEPDEVDESAIIERSRTVEPHNWRSAMLVGLTNADLVRY